MRLALVFLTLAMLSCVSPPPRDREIHALLDRFVAAVNAADTAAFIECFAADATAFLPTTPARRVGVDSIRSALQPVFAQGPRQSQLAHLGELLVTIDQDIAIASFDAGSDALHARRTLVLRKIGGRWQIAHLHASNVIAPQ